MIGWLNEINRLASKGKREDREPGTAARREPARPGHRGQRPGPLPGHRAAPSPIWADSEAENLGGQPTEKA